MAIVDFYSVIEEEADKSEDLKTNLATLFDRLLQDGGIEDPAVLASLAQLKAQVVINLSQLT